MSGPPRVRLYLADDHPLYLEGLARAVRERPDLELVGEGHDGRQALSDLRRLRPDVAVLDVRMPGLGGPEVLEAVRRDGSATRIIFLSAYSDPRTIYAAIADGAAGYLVKEADRETILDTVAAVSRGEVVLSPELQKDLAGQIRLRETRDATGLTAREMQVLREIAEGRSAPEIADRLILSTSTVKSHLQSIYEKLGVSDRAAAVAVGMRRRLLE